MKDKIIICIDCSQEFAWTVDEQEYFKSKGLLAPKRCMICRAAFKSAKDDKFRGKIKK